MVTCKAFSKSGREDLNLRPLGPELTWGFYDNDVSNEQVISYGTGQKREFDVSRLISDDSTTFSVLGHCILFAGSSAFFSRPNSAVQAAVFGFPSLLQKATEASARAISTTNLPAKPNRGKAPCYQVFAAVAQPRQASQSVAIPAAKGGQP